MAQRKSIAFVLLCFFSAVAAMDCPQIFKSDDIEDKVRNFVHQVCPIPILGRDSEAFCCYDSKGRPYCCDFPGFAIFVCIVLILLMILSAIVSCVCCFLCPCCFCYKRRQGGGSFV